MNDQTPENSSLQSPTSLMQAPIFEVFPPIAAHRYEKCITCKDLGKSCVGPKLTALRTISNVREYHRRLRNYRKITMKQIFDRTHNEISDASVKDYFSHEDKDFRWTTVAIIDNALTEICSELAGVRPDEVPPCPATSSEIREKIDAVSYKLQAAEEECLALQAKVAENKGKHIEQMNEYRQDQQARVEYLKADVRLWRKAAFILLGLVVITVAVLVSVVALSLLPPQI